MMESNGCITFMSSLTLGDTVRCALTRGSLEMHARAFGTVIGFLEEDATRRVLIWIDKPTPMLHAASPRNVKVLRNGVWSPVGHVPPGPLFKYGIFVPTDLVLKEWAFNAQRCRNREQKRHLREELRTLRALRAPPSAEK